MQLAQVPVVQLLLPALQQLVQVGLATPAAAVGGCGGSSCRRIVGTGHDAPATLNRKPSLATASISLLTRSGLQTEQSAAIGVLAMDCQHACRKQARGQQ